MSGADREDEVWLLVAPSLGCKVHPHLEGVLSPDIIIQKHGTVLLYFSRCNIDLLGVTVAATGNGRMLGP